MNKEKLNVLNSYLSKIKLNIANIFNQFKLHWHVISHEKMFLKYEIWLK